MVGKTIKRRQLRTTLFLVVSTLVIFAVGCVTLAWEAAQKQTSRADNSTIVGQPSLPAASVNAIFSHAGSPMAGTGAVIEEAARKTNINDVFALAVWWVETNDGMAGVGSGAHNPGGVKGSGNYPVTGGGYTAYPSYSAAVTDWFNIVKARYINAGRTSVYTVCGPYVGTATACSSGGWAGKVSSYMQRYRGMAPQVPSTPTTQLLVSQPVHGSRYFDMAATPQPKATTTTSNVVRLAGEPATKDTQVKQKTLFPLGEAIGIGMALLLALAIAAWGMIMRYGVLTPGKAMQEELDAMAVFPPVFTNRLPSLSDSQPVPVFQPVTEQFTFSGSRRAVPPATRQPRFDSGQFQWQPPLDKLETQVHPAIPPINSGDLKNSDNLPTQFGAQPPAQMPVRLDGQGNGGGLLRRYRSQQSLDREP